MARSDAIAGLNKLVDAYTKIKKSEPHSAFILIGFDYDSEKIKALGFAGSASAVVPVSGVPVMGEVGGNSKTDLDADGRVIGIVGAGNLEAVPPDFIALLRSEIGMGPGSA